MLSDQPLILRFQKRGGLASIGNKGEAGSRGRTLFVSELGQIEKKERK